MTTTFCPSCHTPNIPTGHLCPKCARSARQSLHAAKAAPGWLARLLWWQVATIAKDAAAWGREVARLVAGDALYFKLIGLAVVLLTVAYFWLQAVRQ